ncbi:phosphoribosylanthranilate isomerase [Tepidimonas sp.]|uniref:phosphoribosylanthranilate isomerase n=1 Tax=Tepidimonas sp. TaxID=2002775 RepID=UPI002FDF5D7E
MHRTRIKICGLTREVDVRAAAALDIDAVGFVLYPHSPRAVTAQRAAALAALLPPFITPVLLFVNADADAVAAAVAVVPHAVLQFHGDETPTQCAALAGARPWLRAARVPVDAGATGFDLLEYAQRFAAARAIVVDAHVAGYGGGGQPFDWTAIPWSHPRLRAADRVVLSGGLTPENVTDGVRLVRPWAVDVSSGVESAKGIKDAQRMAAFVAAVRRADATLPCRA